MSAGPDQELEAVRPRGALRKAVRSGAASPEAEAVRSGAASPEAEAEAGAVRSGGLPPEAGPLAGAAPKATPRPSRWARLLRPAAALVLVAATCFAVGGSLRAAGTELADAAGRPGECSC
ncbi:hypothetical protein V6574_24620 [Streptomyces sp. SM1P]